ncbi:hypothetical protein GOBAR_DD09738 [Gossypium barbadense]|nr:hypothetical protein GOBAR_DD09738 [Gossypium barbadense]
MGVVKLDDLPNTENPLPNHNDNGVNMIERSFERVENYCEFHHEEGHEIQECAEFRALVQGLMDNKEMKFYEEVKEEGSICTSESLKVPRVAQPVVIIS